jgi:hypothetical protein
VFACAVRLLTFFANDGYKLDWTRALSRERLYKNSTPSSLGRLSLLDFLLRYNALVDGQPVPRIKADGQPLLLYVDTAIVFVGGEVPPARARNNDDWDRRIVSSM